jgi:uncharacterized peroxidase-related enzyme
MPHIQIPGGLPGIRGLFAFSPKTAAPLCQLAEVLLHTPGTLSLADRELIATYVSSQNDCYYCQMSHGAIAAHHLGDSVGDNVGDNQELVLDVKRDFEGAAISEKLKALLAIAGKVQRGGKNVQPEDVARARQHGATDQEIHDTVLIAAAFCMYNRYVDGLASYSTTGAPSDLAAFQERAAKVARDGYLGIPQDVEAARAAR